MSTAVVTGAGRGIGRAISARLAADGFSVVCADVDGAAAEESASAVGGTAVRCNVADLAEVEALARSLDELSVLVNNAGIWRFTPIAATTIDDFHAVINTNLLGTMLCTQALVPVMARNGGGSVVNLTSIAAKTVTPGVGIYPASKAAVIALTKQTAIEYAELGVRCNAVGPGLVPTEGTGDVHGAGAEEQVARGRMVPLGRLGAPDDIADVVSFFASPASRYVTGQVVYVDGGLTEATLPLLSRALDGSIEQRRTAYA